MAKIVHLYRSALAGISTKLPASDYAQEQLQRAAAAGFKWPNGQAVMGKIREELNEVTEASIAGHRTQLKAEMGDLLHALHTLAVFYGINAQQARQSAFQQSPIASHLVPIQSFAEILDEVEVAVMANDRDVIAEGIGKLLRSIETSAAYHGINVEEALTATNEKFLRRFSATERALAERGRTMADTPLVDMIKIWNAQKDSAGCGIAR